MSDEVQEVQEGPEQPSERMVVHYYLLDDKHSMDALIRNKAEAELLGLVRHVLGELNLGVSVESTAREEGGLIETWVLIANNPALLVTAAIGASVFLTSLINIFISLMNMKDRKGEKLTRKLTELSIEEKALAIEEKTLNIQKLRAELLKPLPDQAVIEKMIPELEYDAKTLTLRSNFFKLLLTYQRVTAVGFGPKPRRGSIAEKIVRRGDFASYVVKTDKLPTVVHRDAVIEIVAPVIGKGPFQWRGIWNGEPVTFQMRDPSYRAMVERGQEVFRRGDAIKCELNIERKVDAVGDEVVTGRVVTAVVAKVEGAKVVETAKGKQRRFQQMVDSAVQDEMFPKAPADDAPM